MIKETMTMNSNVIIEPKMWLPAASASAAQNFAGAKASVILRDPDDKILQMADFSQSAGTAREKIESLLPQLMEDLADCPADQAERKLESCLTQIRRALPNPAEITGWGRVEEELKWVIQALAETIAKRSSDEETQRLMEENKAAVHALAKYQAEIERLKARLQADSESLEAQTQLIDGHEDVIGTSEGIRRVLREVERVALADCSVLINGETGTGKELIAQEIHRLSSRKTRPMVRVNCAALPASLVESELFGRERGAYTGASTSQVGRFEVANGSTIFLDEVGELPLEVQAKLLRVLQEGEFQRLGSPRTIQVNVRVIAATNRDLAEEVRKGRFREDLYYRLKVFPILIPPLRERVEDIPLLVFDFVEEFATRMGKKGARVSREAMETLRGHRWPGNIRELRNVIERSVILMTGDTLKVSVLDDFLAPVPNEEPKEPVTLEEAERHHILKTLEATSWRIKGPNGAAKRLNIEPSTLYSRMKRLDLALPSEKISAPHPHGTTR